MIRRTTALTRKSHMLLANKSRMLPMEQRREIGPLIAGVGVALAAYSAKLLIEAASSGQMQAAMKDAANAASSAANAASSAASSAAASAKSAASSARRRGAATAAAQDYDDEPSSRSSMDSYFTTDVMGVDLGQGAKAWSGACAAIVEGGSPRVVENAQGQRATPSVVTFTDGGEVLVGQPAKKLLFAKNATPVDISTRLLGLPYDSDELKEMESSGLFGRLEVASDSATGNAVVKVLGVSHKPEELSSRLLSTLKESAEAALGNRKIVSAVVGAPVLSSEATHNAMIAAGRRAGEQQQPHTTTQSHNTPLTPLSSFLLQASPPSI